MAENVSALMRAARYLRDSRALSWVIASLAIVAGLGYIVFSPVTTTSHFNGAWPAILWGSAMLIGGVLKCHGLNTKVLDWQLLGLGFMASGVLMVSTAQTMVMWESGWPPTRLGGVAGWWLTMALVLNRMIMVASDRADGQEAQQQVNEREG